MIVTDAKQFGEHARMLAAAFGVELVEADAMKPEGAFASQMIPQGPLAALLAELTGAQEAPRLKGVVVPPIIDETTYAVALHEMGHCLAVCGTLPFERQRWTQADPEYWQVLMTEEEAAWEWARHFALEWTMPMQGVQNWALGTYEKGRLQRAETLRSEDEKRRAQEAWDRQHRVDSPSEFARRIGRNIRFD